ncbi:signal peptide peptidase SppA [Tenacibaculum finnmarkense]|uniref:Signal peptide peptidase SppA n=1 Tax=Tenacibaculum finnmarkense genomovar finnmarkense TaxID=1458503 RepID=A0AAP1RDV6_9FLAO|nr:signal peptide peptidase SppA [Tenacibaculum finnmarkense]MBE7651952.1 signal peptide peptidase SppA [Tenacibaculum finnmarkense genomovar finnmarkense]MBE7694333.1 signal peptide peptidase SppA [Tenacibaculum finnmarkense genomovar finnmarkense]MCD8426169.1 signal peptide peptidase SppA [Tenacibaculum finnmarkense genomovar finnmarkense]MCD8453152.1 signal peptide peptidase SppA [Tenacibaculum finnmarkense genomovar ulcerans]MCG8729961.1 signal peptide peptidase SppA [Tenacibaculum finnmar
MKFLRNLLASITGFFIAIFLLFFFFIAIAAVVGSGMGSDEKIVVKSNSVLQLDLAMPIKDYAPKDDNPLAEILELADEKLALNKIINAIENAKTDTKIKGISIKTIGVNAGIAQTQAIRNKIEEFKESGKFVYAYNDVYTQKNYYLSSVADSIFLNPVGAIDFKGLSTEILYYKDFEDKFGVKMEVIRHGKYKSAVEPYLLNEMSDANREQTTSLLKSIWSEITADVSKSRNISVEKLNIIADSANGRNAELAKENKLIDAIIYEDQYKEKLAINTDKKVHTISLADYIKSGKGRISSSAKNKIAVIYAQGEIRYAKGNENIIGQEVTNKAIRKARKDKNVKAIVLRVNSPGGSALASELIWRELELAKKEKPLVVSMGNLAASGGYYIACNADKIIAEPTTITGSIGVFGAVPNFHKLAGFMGINAEQVSTNSNPNYSVFEPINDKFYTVTKQGVEHIYTVFVNRVATGRNMTFEQVNNVAQGRVWTGKQAVENGLVDQLGNLNDAIAVAANLAEIESYRVRNYPVYKKDFKETFNLSLFAKASKEDILKEALGDENYELYNNINALKKLEGIQARMPYILQIK